MLLFFSGSIVGGSIIVVIVGSMCLLSMKSHLSVILIELEMVGLLLLACLVLGYLSVYLKSLMVFLLLSMLVSEAAVGLSFLVMNSRHMSLELCSFLV